MADGSSLRRCLTSDCPKWPMSPIDLYSFNFLTITNLIRLKHLGHLGQWDTGQSHLHLPAAQRPWSRRFAFVAPAFLNSL
jgi:hypothetical protein